MADDDFDAHWNDAPGGFDDWSAADQSDPFGSGTKPSSAAAAAGAAAAPDDQSYGFGSAASASASAGPGGNALENDFQDEETGSYYSNKMGPSSSSAAAARASNANANQASNRRPPSQGGRSGTAAGRGRRPPPRGSQRGPPSGRSGSRGPGGASGRGRSGRGGGRQSGRGGRQSGRGRSGRGGRGRGSSQQQQQKLYPPGTRKLSDGTIVDKNGTPLGPDGKPLEKNQRYQDLEETGQWGEITRKEKIGAGVILGLLAIGAVLGVVFGVVLKPNPIVEVPGTVSPTASPTTSDFYAYELIKQASPDVEWPDDPTTLLGSAEDANAPSQYKAAEYLLYEDTVNAKPGSLMFMQRYALHVFFLETNGNGWLKSDNWPTGSDICQFHGVMCDYTKTEVVKLVLSENGLSGMIPYEIVSLAKLLEIDVFSNQLAGRLPYKAILDHPRLSTLDVQSNLLTGIIPVELDKSNLGK